MDVPLFFRVSEVCRMLGGASERFIKEELRRGAFFPISAGAVDTSTVASIGGADMVSLVGIQWYLRQSCAWAHTATAAAFLSRRVAGAPELVELPPGIPARTEGELRRKVANG
jgi:hypothetical protein